MVSQLAGCDAGPEQCCSLLELINSLLSDVKLETDAETEHERLIDSSATVNNDAGSPAGEESVKPVEHEQLPETLETSTTDTAAAEPVSGSLSEKDSDEMCRSMTDENTKQPAEESLSDNVSYEAAGKSSDGCDEASDVVEKDVNPSIIQQGDDVSRHANTQSSVADNNDDDDDDDDDDGKLLVELCDKEAVHEGCSTTEPSGDDETVAVSEPVADVLWKDGDIEVRLEVGEDESSNSSASPNVTEQSPLADNSENKLPRTSIRISLSKLTTQINGEDSAEVAANGAPCMKGSVAGRRRAKGFHVQKPKSEKSRMELRRSGSEGDKKRGGLNQSKCDAVSYTHLTLPTILRV